MARYSHYYGFPAYVSVGEKKMRNKQALAKLQNKRGQACPVVVQGRKLAKNWWGECWNANLERYADYSNRIERGRSYVRHGAVLDLQIEPGVITAMVQGSDADPYQIEIQIGALTEKNWADLREAALGQIDSLAELLAGEFPAALRETFFARGTGLFPAPKEISFDCSCPDWASMCKHVAATLYGVGTRLDDDPKLLFTLRQVGVDELIDKTVDATAKNLLDKTADSGDDIIDDADLGDVFGIDLDADDVPPAVSLPAPDPVKPTKPTRTKTKTQTRAKTNTKTGKKRQTSPRKTKKTRKPASAPAPGVTMVDQLVAAIPKSRKEFDTQYIAKKLPDWNIGQIRNTINRALAENCLARVRHGLYRRKNEI
jgi:uncharacterized Zn finger protein